MYESHMHGIAYGNDISFIEDSASYLKYEQFGTKIQSLKIQFLCSNKMIAAYCKMEMIV